MEQALISVIVPVYNAAPYLPACIDSVLAQTHTAFELILVDDGSKDQSLEICRRYAHTDARIKVIHQENAGVSTARNVGLENATGEYICFIDADDYIQNDYLAVLLGESLAHGAEIVSCNYYMQYGTRLVERSLRVPSRAYTFAELESLLIDDGTLTGILFGSACMALYKAAPIREYGLRFNKALPINEDGIFNLQLLPHVGCIYVSDYKGYFYRQWKTKKKGTFGRNAKLDSATAAIAQCCAAYADITLQLQRREASVIFWTLLSASTCAESAFQTHKKLKAFLRQTDIAAACACLDMTKLNRYKRTIIKMAAKKQAFLLIAVIRYAYPLLRKFLKR